MIFDTFDEYKKGKIKVEYLPKILRLLNYNVGKIELQELTTKVDELNLLILLLNIITVKH